RAARHEAGSTPPSLPTRGHWRRSPLTPEWNEPADLRVGRLSSWLRAGSGRAPALFRAHSPNGSSRCIASIIELGSSTAAAAASGAGQALAMRIAVIPFGASTTLLPT